MLEEKINALANIAVIGPYIRIRAQNPMDYIDRYEITAEKLRQQFIEDDIRTVEVAQYPEWLQRRATVLAKAANEFIEGLRA